MLFPFLIDAPCGLVHFPAFSLHVSFSESIYKNPTLSSHRFFFFFLISIYVVVACSYKDSNLDLP